MSNERTQPILQAALKVFLCKSYHGSTTKEVADAAGVSVGTLFRLFPNKEDLLLGLLNELAEKVAPRLLSEQLDTALEGYLGGDADALLRSFIHGRLVLFQQNRDLISVMHSESAYNPKLRAAMYDLVYLPMRRLIEQFVGLGVARGYFRDVDAATAARCISSAVLYNFIDVWYQDLDLTTTVLDSLETPFVDLILRGLERRIS